MFGSKKTPNEDIALRNDLMNLRTELKNDIINENDALRADLNKIISPLINESNSEEIDSRLDSLKKDINSFGKLALDNHDTLEKIGEKISEIEKKLSI